MLESFSTHFIMASFTTVFLDLPNEIIVKISINDVFFSKDTVIGNRLVHCRWYVCVFYVTVRYCLCLRPVKFPPSCGGHDCTTTQQAGLSNLLFVRSITRRTWWSIIPPSTHFMSAIKKAKKVKRKKKGGLVYEDDDPDAIGGTKTSLKSTSKRNSKKSFFSLKNNTNNNNREIEQYNNSTRVYSSASSTLQRLLFVVSGQSDARV